MGTIRLLAMLSICSFLCVPNLFGQSCPTICGDVNGDGLVDINDLVSLASFYDTPGAPQPSICGNVDGCRNVNAADMLLFAWRMLEFDHPFEDCSITASCLTQDGGRVRLGCRPWDVYPGGDSVAIPVLVSTVAGIRGITLGFSYTSENIQITSVSFGQDISTSFALASCRPNDKEVGVAVALTGSTPPVYTDAVLCKLNARVLSGDPLQLIMLEPAMISPAGDWLFVGDVKPYYLPDFDQGLCCDDCGDANSDGTIDISDCVFLLAYIFSSGTAPGFCNYPLGMGDANGDGTADISDVVYLITMIFTFGPAPHCMGMQPIPMK